MVFYHSNKQLTNIEVDSQLMYCYEEPNNAVIGNIWKTVDLDKKSSHTQSLTHLRVFSHPFNVVLAAVTLCFSVMDEPLPKRFIRLAPLLTTVLDSYHSRRRSPYGPPAAPRQDPDQQEQDTTPESFCGN
ncbi:hypothetical protein STEG23_013004 [Scotinomys teguina]